MIPQAKFPLRIVTQGPGHSPSKPGPAQWQILRPFNPVESISVAAACVRSGRSGNTIRNWCRDFGIGRKIGGEYFVSRPALEMQLDGNEGALALYLGGQRSSEEVLRYFRMVGLT